ncbi:MULTISPECIES: hypothetical protein [unclassified Providencia]|uniref:hypothetical protein n=1 Tax=unclassified Providencia TaxID=2633465 RepID=UPI0028822D8D|nr:MULTISPECIES: hypothetical protein [unclassified Providencia]
MKKGLVVLLLGLASFSSFVSIASVGANERPEITEDDVVPDMAASINRQKALLCGAFEKHGNIRTCKRLVDNMVALAYSQGEVSMGCKLKADDPKYKEIPNIEEYCDKAKSLISNLSPND